MQYQRVIYKDLAAMNCRLRGHPDPWPCFHCLAEFADHAIAEAERLAARREREACAKLAEAWIDAGLPPEKVGPAIRASAGPILHPAERPATAKGGSSG